MESRRYLTSKRGGREEWNAELDRAFRLIYGRHPAIGDELMEPDATIYRFTGSLTGWERQSRVRPK